MVDHNPSKHKVTAADRARSVRLATRDRHADRACGSGNEAELIATLRSRMVAAAEEHRDDDVIHSRDWRAAHNLVEVDRMSRAGMKVAAIGKALGLSIGRVVQLRSILGVGRCR